MEASRPRPVFSFETAPHIFIVEARFYNDIADMLLEGVRDAIETSGASSEILTVPGALEIPAAISFAIKAMDFRPTRRRPDGFIALGCVIKGGTSHDQIVAFESARGLQDLALKHALAIGNGILTCNDLDQAQDRADPKRLNRGREAAEACLRMVEIKQQMGLTPKRRWSAK